MAIFNSYVKLPKGKHQNIHFLMRKMVSLIIKFGDTFLFQTASHSGKPSPIGSVVDWSYNMFGSSG